MAIDDRILYLVREEISKALSPLGASEKTDDLHKELHEVATRVAALERQAEPKTGYTTQPDAAPRGNRTRKIPDA